MPVSQDDDDRDRNYDDLPRSTSGNTTVKIIAIVGGVLLGIALICGGITFFVVQTIRHGAEAAKRSLEEAMAKMEQEAKAREEAQKNSSLVDSQRAAEAFLREIRDTRYGIAYQSTTQRFQTQMSMEELQGFIKVHPALRSSNPTLQLAPNSLPGGMRYEFKAIEGPRILYTLVVVKEGLGWKVDELHSDYLP